MPLRFAQRMTLSDLKWPFHASRSISAVTELLVLTAYNLQFCNPGRKNVGMTQKVTQAQQ